MKECSFSTGITRVEHAFAIYIRLVPISNSVWDMLLGNLGWGSQSNSSWEASLSFFFHSFSSNFLPCWWWLLFQKSNLQLKGTPVAFDLINFRVLFFFFCREGRRVKSGHAEFQSILFSPTTMKSIFLRSWCFVWWALHTFSPLDIMCRFFHIWSSSWPDPIKLKLYARLMRFPFHARVRYTTAHASLTSSACELDLPETVLTGFWWREPVIRFLYAISWKFVSEKIIYIAWFCHFGSLRLYTCPPHDSI